MSSHHPTRKAIFEFAKLVCSIYTLRYLGDPPQLQRNVHRSQNRIESYHQLRAFIAENHLSGVFWRLAMDQSRFPKSFFVGSVYEWILSSRALPRGYGYARHGPEGDDPGEEDVDLSTYRKEGGASSLWSD